MPRTNGPTSWHAQPRRYPLDAGSAGELEEYIAADDRRDPRGNQ